MITKARDKTYGLDYFFSSLLKKTVPGLSFFTLALISVKQRPSYPVCMEQTVRTTEEKSASQAKKQTKKAKSEGPKRKRGRPKGSRNKNKADVVLNPELQRIQKMLQTLLITIQGTIHLTYLVLDGHFGNHPALHMVRQCQLHLISKLRSDAALFFPYTGLSPKRGPRPRLGGRMDVRKVPEAYLKETKVEDGIETRTYQMQLLHREFPEPLNVVVLLKINLETKAWAYVILFSSDLELPYHKLLDFYSLRFQIEIVCTQMTKAGVFTTWAGWNNVADFNFFIVNNYSVYQQFYQLPTLFKIQFIQSWLNTVAEFLDVVCQCKRLNLLLGLVLQLSQLLLEAVLGLSQFLALSLKFISRNDFCQVHLQETLLLPFQTCQGLSDGISFGLQGLRQPFSSLSAIQFMGDQVWSGYNAAKIPPNKFIQLLGWRIAGCTTFTFSSSMNITPSSACVIVIPPLGTASSRQMTLATTDQTAEKVIVALVVSTGHILIFRQARLGSIKYFLINNGWHRDCNPFLWRGRLDTLTSPYWQQGRFTLPCRDWPSASAVRNANIRWGMQNTPNRGWIPTVDLLEA